MRDFINRVHILIDEHRKLSEKTVEDSKLLKQHERATKNYGQVKQENAELKRKVAKLTKDNEAVMKAFSKIREKGPTAQPSTKPYTTPSPHKGSAKTEPNQEQTGYSAFASLKEPNYFTCQKDEKAYDLKELPCIVNPLLSCPKKVCEQQVMKVLIMHTLVVLLRTP